MVTAVTDDSSEDERDTFQRSNMKGLPTLSAHEMSEWTLPSQTLAQAHLHLDTKRKHGQLRKVGEAALREKVASFLANPPNHLLRAVVWQSPCM